MTPTTQTTYTITQKGIAHRRFLLLPDEEMQYDILTALQESDGTLSYEDLVEEFAHIGDDYRTYEQLNDALDELVREKYVTRR